jgi:hemolysin activation/secretion protein
LTANNTRAAFQPGLNQSGRPFASAHYLYFRSDVNRLTKLPRDLSYSLHMNAQSTTSNLLYTEQLAGGGPDILRGYTPFAALGDEGLLISNEVRGPAWRKIGEVSAMGAWQLLGFFDYGSLHAYQPAAGYSAAVNASSTGVGVRYSIRSNVTAKLDYGWALRTVPGEQAASGMASISLTVGN